MTTTPPKNESSAVPVAYPGLVQSFQNYTRAFVRLGPGLNCWKINALFPEQNGIMFSHEQAAEFLASIKPTLPDTAPPRALDTPRSLYVRLSMAQVASCKCNTKTDVIEYHDDLCPYRLFQESAVRIAEQGRDLTEAREQLSDAIRFHTDEYTNRIVLEQQLEQANAAIEVWQREAQSAQSSSDEWMRKHEDEKRRADTEKALKRHHYLGWKLEQSNREQADHAALNSLNGMLKRAEQAERRARGLEEALRLIASDNHTAHKLVANAALAQEGDKK